MRAFKDFNSMTFHQNKPGQSQGVAAAKTALRGACRV